MKKAKILLMTVAILAVVGGAFAFKANKLNKITYYTTTDPKADTFSTCPLTVQATKTVINPLTDLATTIPGGLCRTILITTDEGQ